jgi:benzoyl-CoA reductase subunit D
MITAGLDMGAGSAKVVILKDNKILSMAKEFVGFEPTKAAEKAIEDALKKAKISRKDIEQLTATGAGIDLAPPHDSKASMLSSMGRAGHYYFPKAKTVLDVGAEDARAVKINEKGVMVDFVVNERCAAGAGTFIEAMARALQVKTVEMGPLSLKSEKPSSINATCVVFGESDVVTLVHKKESKADIARSVFEAMADRVISMMHRLGINPPVVVIGGVANDVGFVDAMNKKLGLELLIPENPGYAGALGAALIAAEK